MKRKHISLKTKLASALCVVFGIPYADAQMMTEDQVLSLAAWDHYPIPKHAGGSDVFWNLTPMPILEHRLKTSTYDVPVHAKYKRITKKEEEFQRKLLAKDWPGAFCPFCETARQEEPTADWRCESCGKLVKIVGPQSRLRWPKRKLRSRNNLRRAK